uniref:Uncharacterized protein n=1 Tax=Helianthus annuus TaxID=4232 RepID=A0A251TZ14_HELAN
MARLKGNDHPNRSIGTHQKQNRLSNTPNITEITLRWRSCHGGEPPATTTPSSISLFLSLSWVKNPKRQKHHCDSGGVTVLLTAVTLRRTPLSLSLSSEPV